MRYANLDLVDLVQKIMYMTTKQKGIFLWLLLQYLIDEYGWTDERVSAIRNHYVKRERNDFDLVLNRFWKQNAAGLYQCSFLDVIIDCFHSKHENAIKSKRGLSKHSLNTRQSVNNGPAKDKDKDEIKKEELQKNEKKSATADAFAASVVPPDADQEPGDAGVEKPIADSGLRQPTVAVPPNVNPILRSNQAEVFSHPEEDQPSPLLVGSANLKPASDFGDAPEAFPESLATNELLESDLAPSIDDADVSSDTDLDALEASCQDTAYNPLPEDSDSTANFGNNGLIEEAAPPQPQAAELELFEPGGNAVQSAEAKNRKNEPDCLDPDFVRKNLDFDWVLATYNETVAGLCVQHRRQITENKKLAGNVVKTFITLCKIEKCKTMEDGYLMLKDFIESITVMPHLCGENDRGWRATIEFVFNPNNFDKIYDGAYVPRKKQGNS